MLHPPLNKIKCELDDVSVFISLGWFGAAALRVLSHHLSRWKAKHILRNWTGVALHAWVRRQLRNWVWNNGEEIKKQSTRKSLPFAICLRWEALGGHLSHMNLHRTTLLRLQGPSAIEGGTQPAHRYSMAKCPWPYNLSATSRVCSAALRARHLAPGHGGQRFEGSILGWWRTPEEIPSMVPSVGTICNHRALHCWRKGLEAGFGQALRHWGRVDGLGSTMLGVGASASREA